MLGTVKQLAKHSTIYGLGSLLGNLLGFVLLPIYTRCLTPAEYGILSILGVTGSVAGVVAQLGIGFALFREVVYQNSDESTAESTALYFLLGESALLFGGLIALSGGLSVLMFNTARHAYLLRLIFLTGLLSTFDVVVMARLRIRERSAIYSALSIARVLVGASLSIYYIVVLRRGVEGLVTAGLIQAGLFSVVCVALLARELRLTFCVPILRRMLSMGVPIVPANLSSLAMTSADRYFLQHYSTSTEVGLYSVGYKIAMVVNLAVQAVQLAWPAQMFAIAKRPDAERQFARLLTYYLAGIGFAGLALSVLAKEALTIMATPRFYGAYAVVPLVALSYIFYGVRFMTSTGMSIRNKMGYMAPTVFGAAVLNLVLNYLLIPGYGMMGAAWATVIAYFALLVVHVIVNQHYMRIAYEYRRISRIALVSGLIYGVSLLIRTPSAWVNGGLKVGLLATYPLLLYAFRFYEKEELAAIKRIFGLTRAES